MLELMNSLFTTYLILCGMVLAVPLVMDAVLKLGYHGSIGNYLHVSVVDDFEVRICKDETHANEDVAIEQLDIFVI